MFSRVCHLLAIILICPGVVDAALVSHYTFDDVNDLGADSGSFGNVATPGDGDPAFTSASKVGPGALELDGNDTLFISGAAPDFTSLDDNGDGFTVAAWVNIDPAASPGATMRIMSYAMGGGFDGRAWGVGFRNGGDALLATTYGRTDYNSSIPVPAGQWTHVAYRFAFNGEAEIDAVDFFVDGQLVGTDNPGPNGMINASSGTFSIGNINIPGNEQYFHGRIDDLRVYDTELTNSEIAAIVPEPSSLALILAGLFGLALATRRRRGRWTAGAP